MDRKKAEVVHHDNIMLLLICMVNLVPFWLLQKCSEFLDEVSEEPDLASCSKDEETQTPGVDSQEDLNLGLDTLFKGYRISADAKPTEISLWEAVL